jgi:hypothetical protein
VTLKWRVRFIWPNGRVSYAPRPGSGGPPAQAQPRADAGAKRRPEFIVRIRDVAGIYLRAPGHALVRREGGVRRDAVTAGGSPSQTVLASSPAKLPTCNFTPTRTTGRGQAFHN